MGHTIQTLFILSHQGRFGQPYNSQCTPYKSTMRPIIRYPLYKRVWITCPIKNYLFIKKINIEKVKIYKSTLGPTDHQNQYNETILSNDTDADTNQQEYQRQYQFPIQNQYQFQCVSIHYRYRRQCKTKLGNNNPLQTGQT